jgi:hypothetical protein
MSVASELECESERAAAMAQPPKTPLETSVDSDASPDSIRSRSRTSGFGLLSLAAITLAALKGARGAEPNVAILDDDHITYKELDHGKFELVTKEAIPRHIIVDDPGETVVIKRSGSSMSVDPVGNNATRMEELSKAQQEALANYEKGMAETGSSAPPFSEPGLVQPINFIQSDDAEATQTALAPVPVFVFTSAEVPIERLPPPPPPPPPTLEITEIGGAIGVAANNIINVARADAGVQITGTTSGVEDARIVTVTIVDSSGQVVYSGTAPVNDNTWSINISPAQAKTLADGMDTLTAVVTNAAGDSAQASHPIRVDETPPTIAINNTIVSYNVVNVKVASAGFAIAGTTTDAENGQPVTVKIVDSSGQVVDTFTTTLTKNTWSVNVTSDQAKLLHDGSYTVTADVSDTAGNPAQEATQAIAVDETPPTVKWLPPAECGIEGRAIALGSIAATANSVPGHSNNVQSLVVSGIPVGAVFTDGTNCFVATSGDTSVDVKCWNLSNLKITPPNDTNFTLTVTATDQDANTASANELVKVAPLAPALCPVAAHGNEDTAIALDLGVMARSLSGANGDASPNSLATLVVSDIPAGATLSDGTGLPGHSFTASAANTSFDVANWNLSCLKITAPAEFEGCFTLTIAATDRDSEGDISATVTATEVVTVAPVAKPPTACAPATLTLNENATCVAIAGVSVGPLAEDADDTVRATLTVSHGTLHVAGLSGVTVTGDDCATLTLSGSAAAVDALLAGLTYTPTHEYEGRDTLHLSVTSRDGSNTYPVAATASTSIIVKDRDDWSDGVVATVAASNFTAINGSSGTEISTPPAASGTVTKGTTGEIAAASATASDFASASGTNASLVPGNTQNFTRQVTGLTGDSTAGTLPTTEAGVSADTPDNTNAAAALNTGDALADMIMGGFGAVLLTGGIGIETISAANAVPDTTKDGGNGDTIAGERWAHSLSGHSTDDHFVFLSADQHANAVREFKPKPDRIDLTALSLADFVILALDTTSTSVPAHTIAWIYDGKADQTTVYLNPTDHSLSIGDTSLTEIHLHGMVTIEPSELAFTPEAMAPVVAAEATDPGAATTHDDVKAVATISADASSSATSDVHDKPTGQASDQGHGLETDHDRFARLDHAGSIRDDEGGKHATETASDQTAMVPADSQPSVKPQHALPTETTIAPDHSTTFDKADASTGSSAAVTVPSYVVPTAATAAPDVPDAPELKTDIHVNKHGLTLGHDWIQSSRGDWQFNFSWKSDGWSHAADIGISDVHMNMSGANAFHFELPSTTHAASAAGEMFGHANSVHFNEENSGAAQPPVDHFHATLHAAHELMV